MALENATLIRWNNDKGFGFLQPEKGKKEIFLHIKSLPHYQRRPRVGDRLKVVVERDDGGQLFARSARICGPALSPFTMAAIMIVLLLVLYFLLVASGVAPWHLGAVYLLMSLVTIAVYSVDKGRAEQQLWRIPETRLHLLELLGGWPGALLAQIFYRHKLSKPSYLVVFWTIVACHGGAWYVAHSHPAEIGKLYLTVNTTVGPLFEKAKKTTMNALPVSLIEVLSRTTPATAVKSATSPFPSARSIKKAPPNAVIVKGTIKEIRPELGLVVTLDKGLEGIVPRSTLVENFPAAFTAGETIRFAVLKISLVNGQSRVEGLVVEP